MVKTDAASSAPSRMGANDDRTGRADAWYSATPPVASNGKSRKPASASDGKGTSVALKTS
jgi:hypothetical protein